MPDKVYRTAIYCRLSREDGDKVESNSIASQRAICEDYIARHEDLELVCEPFVDDGYSGVSFNRPQFKKLEEAIRKGALDCIVVKDSILPVHSLGQQRKHRLSGWQELSGNGY